MAADSTSESYLTIPCPALLAFAVSLIFYLLHLLDQFRPPAILTGIVLVCGAAVQLIFGIYSRQKGNRRNAAILLPFGLFWLSLVGYEIFPALGIGRHPGAIAMFSYMSLWGLFAAILFLASFRSHVAVQIFFCAMMASLLSLSMQYLREDRVFLFIGIFCGAISSLSATYLALFRGSRRASAADPRECELAPDEARN